MRRLLTTLVILLAVLVAGMTTLVLLVNPNDFRAYMVKQVARKSGYQLNFDGDLRWHVWPQFSIIAGRMTLTVPGAPTPVVSAENMRLDVKLWPLLFHRLEIEEIMLKRAVISLTPESQPLDIPVAVVNSRSPTNGSSAWALDIRTVKLVDSLLIWQKINDDQINIRSLNLDLVQNKPRQLTVSISSQVNRNQRDLTFSLGADLDLRDYPQQINANVNQFTYRLEGADIPVIGISGEGNTQASYQAASRRLALNQLQVQINNNLFTGNASATLDDIPDYLIKLTAKDINLDSIEGWQPPQDKRQTTAEYRVITAPVIANQDEDIRQGLQKLRDFNAHLTLNADTLVYRGIKINQLELAAENKRGNLVIQRLLGHALNGDFSILGTANVIGNRMQLAIEPVVNHMELAPILSAFGLPPLLSGAGSMKGELSGDGLNMEAFSRRWQGYVKFGMEKAQFHGINIQQLIQQAVTNSTSEVSGKDDYVTDTSIQKLRADLTLHQGILKVSNLSGDSALLALKGKAMIDLPMQQCDINLNVRVIQDWRGNSDLIRILQNTEIPLRIYGSWQQLKYKLDVESLLRDELRQKAKEAFDGWVERNIIEGNRPLVQP